VIYCGIDWAEHHHDVALVDDTAVTTGVEHREA
jgi:hypothetical protein